MAPPPPKKSSLPAGVGFMMQKQDRGPATAPAAAAPPAAADADPDAAAAVADGGGEDDAPVTGVDPQLEEACKKLLSAYGPKQLKDAVQSCIEQYGTDPEADETGEQPAVAGNDDEDEGDHEYR